MSPPGSASLPGPQSRTSFVIPPLAKRQAGQWSTSMTDENSIAPSAFDPEENKGLLRDFARTIEGSVEEKDFLLAYRMTPEQLNALTSDQAFLSALQMLLERRKLAGATLAEKSTVEATAGVAEISQILQDRNAAARDKVAAYLALAKTGGGAQRRAAAGGGDNQHRLVMRGVSPKGDVVIEWETDQHGRAISNAPDNDSENE
jgi:hypothetical protein